MSPDSTARTETPSEAGEIPWPLGMRMGSRSDGNEGCKRLLRAKFLCSNAECLVSRADSYEMTGALDGTSYGSRHSVSHRLVNRIRH